MNARALCLLPLAAVAVLAAPADEPTFEVKPAKAADVVTVSKTGSPVTIQSKTGIGAAVIQLTAGHWPRNVVFLFQDREGQPFKGLEQVKLTTAAFKLEGSMADSGKMPYFVVAQDGKFEAMGQVNVHVKAQKDGIAVTLPPDLLKATRRLELNWVDFFR